jgi:hypothetical protein
MTVSVACFRMGTHCSARDTAHSIRCRQTPPSCARLDLCACIAVRYGIIFFAVKCVQTERGKR